MVIWSAFRMGQYSVNDHPYRAPQFIDNANSPFKKELTFTSFLLNHESHPGEEAARRKNQNRNYKQFDCIVVELC